MVEGATMTRIMGAALAAALALAGCARTPAPQGAAGAAGAAGPVTVKLIAFNDFHGNLQPSGAVDAPDGKGGTVKVPVGGAAWFASAVAALRAENPNHLVVSAGDMISASPLVSSLFLDEPTIHAMNLIGVDLNAVGNHEFDRGRDELKRMQDGGCAKFTMRRPCQLEPFPGARFRYLAANVAERGGATLFPGTALRSFGEGAAKVTIGFIGMTLKATPSIVSPAGVAGLTFADEAETANALVPKLKEQGADAVVVLIHQGGATTGAFNDKACPGFSGDLLPILDRLDPRVDLVVSGHTHRAYLCDYGRINPSRPFLVTSGGQAGGMLTDIELTIDPAAHRVTAKTADNILVQSEGRVPPSDLYRRYAPDPRVTALVARYADASRTLVEQPVGRLSGPAERAPQGTPDSVLGNLIADAQLAATRAPDKGGAVVAFMNLGGVRADLTPRADGTVTFGDIYATQPFGNTLTTRSFTGRQLKAVLEQQFDTGRPGGNNVLLPSASLRYGFDLGRPVGQRVIDPRIDGQPIEDARTYRVTASDFLMNGGDGFTSFAAGTDPLVGMDDLRALQDYFAAAGTLTVPTAGRVKDLTLR